MGDAWWVAWVVLGAELALLTFVGFWFSLRALRWSTAVTGLALVIAVASFGLTHSGPASSNLVDSFLRGADDVINALMHPTGHVPSSGVTDRWVLAVVLVIGYCMLEAWTVRRQAPELDLSEISGDAADGSKATAAAAGSAAPPGGRDDEQRRRLAAELRFRLTTMQVRAPAILPGGTRANELASIAEASGYSGGGLIGAVLRFTGLVWPHPRRLRVRAWVESPEASGAPEASRVPQAPPRPVPVRHGH